MKKHSLGTHTRNKGTFHRDGRTFIFGHVFLHPETVFPDVLRNVFHEHHSLRFMNILLTHVSEMPCLNT